jgi:head-tail adaptor
MRASELNERVTKLSRSTSENEIGEETSAFAAGETVPAQVEVASPSEQVAGGTDEEQTQITVRGRNGHFEGVGRKSFLRYRGDRLRVNGRESIGFRERFVELQCTRVRPDG